MATVSSPQFGTVLSGRRHVASLPTRGDAPTTHVCVGADGLLQEVPHQNQLPPTTCPDGGMHVAQHPGREPDLQKDDRAVVEQLPASFQEPFIQRHASPRVADILSATLDGHPLNVDDAAFLLASRGADLAAVCRAADTLRCAVVPGNSATYVVNRNINYTNVCTFGCAFCAFSKGEAS